MAVPHAGKSQGKPQSIARVIHPTFGKNVSWWRETRGLSLGELARAAGVSKSPVHAYEAQRSNPSYERACAIAKALEIPVPYIWDHQPPPLLPHSQSHSR